MIFLRNPHLMIFFGGCARYCLFVSLPYSPFPGLPGAPGGAAPQLDSGRTAESGYPSPPGSLLATPAALALQAWGAGAGWVEVAPCDC